MTEAIRSAKHFFASRALPPYPEPYDQTSRVSGNCTMYFVSLQGQATSGCGTPRSSRSGCPTLCTVATHGTPVSIARSTSGPRRVVMPILRTTYAESVTSTPSCEIGPPTGPIENGTTYMVRPRMLPAKRSSSSARIAVGSRQWFVGRRPRACGSR